MNRHIELEELELPANVCHSCGHQTMIERHGAFRFTPPPNIPGGEIVIPNSVWRECATCGEQLIGHEIDMQLDAEAARRRRQETTTHRLKYILAFLLGMVVILIGVAIRVIIQP